MSYNTQQLVRWKKNYMNTKKTSKKQKKVHKKKKISLSWGWITFSEIDCSGNNLIQQGITYNPKKQKLNFFIFNGFHWFSRSVVVMRVSDNLLDRSLHFTSLYILFSFLIYFSFSKIL